MMKFPFAGAVLALFVVSCALDIPPKVEPSPAAKGPYDVSSDGGTVVRHYDGNDRLLSIDRYVFDKGLATLQYHYSAQEVLLWYEACRFELFGSQWQITRKLHYTPPKDAGTLSWSKSWSYDASGNNVLAVDFDAANSVSGYHHAWGETAAAGYRWLQSTWLSASGTPTWYDLYRYAGASDNLLSGWAALDGNRNVSRAQAYDYDVDKNQTSLVEYQKDASFLSKTTGTFVPSTSIRYRAAWYRAAASTPTPPDFASAPPPVPVNAASTDSTDSAKATMSADPDPADTLAPGAAISGFTPVSYLDFPTLPVPGTWTPQAFEYYLPGPHGTITLRFDGNGLPSYLVKEALGAFDSIRLDFVWDLQNQLQRRVASYADHPVLTVDLHRDDQGRIDRIDTAGSMMKIPLTYKLVYVLTAERPASLTLASGSIDLLTMGFDYDDDHAGAGQFGFGPLQFDDHIQSIRVAIGGAVNPLDVIGLRFQAPVTVGDVTTKAALVYDILNKPLEENQILKGRLLWTQDANGNQTSFLWQTASADAVPAYTTAWTYQHSWGDWGSLPDNAIDAADGAVTETVDAMKTKLAQAMTLVDSFDFERVFQLVNLVETQLPGQQAQFERSAGSVLNQVKAAAGLGN